MNYDLFKAINNLSGNGFADALMKDVAKYLIFASFLVLAVLCLLRLRDRLIRPIVATAATLVLTFVLGLVGAAAYSEKRPFQSHHVHQLIPHAGGQSFPSDHATAAFGVALAVAAFLSLGWGVVLFLVALLIGFARVYDGIHYPLDIAGGLAAAIVAVIVVSLVNRLANRVTDRPRTDQPAGALN